MSKKTNERRFRGKPSSLRSNERLALLEIDRVITLSTEGLRLERILDVGTGTGIFAEAFVVKGLEVVGIDANAVMVEVARRLARCRVRWC